MSFTSPSFLVFFAFVYLAYWNLRRRGQNYLILISSLVFYGWWDWRFLFLLLFNAGIDFVAAHYIEKENDSIRRKAWLGFSLCSNLGLLGFFKYFNFFLDTLQVVLGKIGIAASPMVLQVILPVGISFYTFQALSYTIDVYRRRTPAVRDAVQYFSFITFFPHMVAGPIQQAHHFLVQFGRDRTFDWSQSVDGARQMLWGFFKKMVIADNLAPLVDTAFNNPASASGSQLLLATYFFAVQIYCDFSGYTDIAIGCARMFDLHMTRNFAYPYFSQSIPEFWRRWHITLSTWFREYLYIPLGGNRVGLARQSFNVMIVFLVSGLWHGANWTFLVWGFLHGVFFIVYEKLGMDGKSQMSEAAQSKFSLPSLILVLINFHLVCLAWVFFRANSLQDAILILGKIPHALIQLQPAIAESGRCLFLVLILVAVEWLYRLKMHPLQNDRWPWFCRWTVYYAIVIAILLLSPVKVTPFIYFQF